MEFTEAYKLAGPCCFSPNSRYIAVAVDYRLVIRDTISFKVVQLFSCLDKISYIEWANDSEYILCGLHKRPMIQAWSLTQPEWTCKIDEGSAGIAYSRWSPDSRHILTTSDFQLRLTVWSLLNTACVHVQGPKYGSKGVSFTKEAVRIPEAGHLRCSAAEIGRFVAMLRNPSSILKACSAFALLQFTIPGGRHTLHHTSLLRNAGAPRVLGAAAAAATAPVEAKVFAKILLRNLEHHHLEALN